MRIIFFFVRVPAVIVGHHGLPLPFFAAGTSRETTGSWLEEYFFISGLSVTNQGLDQGVVESDQLFQD
jgi:hypothetical protein